VPEGIAKEDSSFSEEKEAKRLLQMAVVDVRRAPERIRVFCFFFAKKKAFLLLPCA
jgi:hypothetical protein